MNGGKMNDCFRSEGLEPASQIGGLYFRKIGDLHVYLRWNMLSPASGKIVNDQ
jgi:hypothetical protein